MPFGQRVLDAIPVDDGVERVVGCDRPRIELTGTRSSCFWIAESQEIRVGRFDIGPSEVEFGRALRHGSRAAGPGFGGQPFRRPRFRCWTQVNRVRQLAKSLWSITSVATWPDCSDVPCGSMVPYLCLPEQLWKPSFRGLSNQLLLLKGAQLFDLDLSGLALSRRECSLNNCPVPTRLCTDKRTIALS